MKYFVKQWFREPSAINAAQTGVYLMGVAGGLLSALGGVPNLITGTIGTIMAVIVGSILVVGGLIGSFGVMTGHWWLERIALLITAIGWFALLPATLYYIMSGRSSAVWLIVTLIIGSLLSIFIRYRRIDWAYLDPAK